MNTIKKSHPSQGNNHPPEKKRESKQQEQKEPAAENSNAAIEEKGKTKQYTQGEKKPKKKTIF